MINNTLAMSNNRIMHRLFSSSWIIVIILVFSSFLHLENMSGSMIGVASWRQADTASIARNYYEHGMNFLYPEVDWGGAGQNYIDSELPIYPYTVAIAYTIIGGVKESVGQYISLLFFILSAWIIYWVIKKEVDHATATITTALYSLLPLNVYYSGTFQPEGLLLLLLALHILFLFRWAKKPSILWFFLLFLFFFLAVAVKPLSLFFIIPMLYVFSLYKEKFKKPLIKYLLLAIISALPTITWYFHAHQLFLATGNTFWIWDYGKEPWGSALGDISSYGMAWQSLLVFITRNLGVFFIPFLCIGIFIARYSKNIFSQYCSMVAICLFSAMFFLPQGFYAQEYYVLPFSLGFCYCISVGLQKELLTNIKQKPPRWWFASISFCLAIGASSYCFFLYQLSTMDPAQLKLQAFAQHLPQEISPETIVITDIDNGPYFLYASHRKGLYKKPIDAHDASYIEYVRGKGVKYYIGSHTFVDKEIYTSLKQNFRLVYDDQQYFIYSLIDLLPEPTAPLV